jgi:Cof subfamily protein (haloacid dehalogenase superfamily)
VTDDDAGQLPATGSIEVVSPEDAAEIVDELAEHPAEADAAPGADADGGTGGDAPASAQPLLIALDIDGTVILEDESLSPGVVDAVAAAQRAGHEVMLATGRSWEGTHGILELLNIEPEYVVCSNGAVIMRREGAGYVRHAVETFDATEVLEMLRVHLPEARYMVELVDGQRLYTQPMDDWNLQHARRVSFEELSAQPVCRVVVVSADETNADFLQTVESIGLTEVTYAVGWSAWLDIAPQGVDKGVALERVRQWRGVDPAHVLVMGDGRNDIGMFRWAREHGGRAIAMAQGPEEVLREASETTTSVHAGGVAEVLRLL